MKAFIMAGGFGTRMRPLTVNLPKPMIPIVNRPIMEIIVDLLKKHRITDLVSILYFQPAVITEYFKDGSAFGVQMQYRSADSDLGTAGCVRNCQELLDKGRFLVISGDVLTDFDLTEALKFHEQRKAKATMVLTRVENPLAFGVVITGRDGRIERFLEKPTWGEVFSDTVNTGIYILEPDVLDRIPPGVEFDFAKDLFPGMLKEDLPIYGYVADGYWRDVGNLDQYRLVHQDIFNGKVEIDIPGKRLNRIGREIWVGEGSTVDPSAQLSGAVVVGRNCNIGKGAVISNSVIGDGCQIEEGVQLTQAILWGNVSMGAQSQAKECVLATGTDVAPKAAIFEGAIVSDNCVIGKEAVLRAAVKVWPHKVVEDGARLSASLVWGDKWARNLFGQYGVSGVAGIELNPEFASKLGAAYGASLPRNSTVIASRDIHKTCRMINRALISGILSSGVHVHDLREVPISVARYAAPRLGDLGGLYTTKSAFDDRSVDIKFFGANGLALPSSKEKGIENLFYREDFRRALMEETGDLSFPHRVLEYYQEGFLNALQTDAILVRKPKVVIDYAFSSASPIFPQLLGKLGCEMVALNAYMDASKLTKTPAELRSALKQLCDIVPTLKADFGVMFDAGAEQIYVVDEKGHLLTGSEMLAFFLRYTFARRKGALAVVPVSASHTLEAFAKKHGGKIQRSRTSSYHMMEAAAQKDVAFAGGPEGGYMFPDFAPFMDAMMSTARIMECVATGDKPVSHYIEELPATHFLSREAACPWEMKGTIMRNLIEDTASEKRDLIDGIKVYRDGTSVMMLPDADRACFHVTAEAQSEKDARQLVEAYVEKIRGWLR